MSRKEFIDIFKSIYVADPSKRAVDDRGRCNYLMEDGRKCSIGMYLESYHPDMEGKDCRNSLVFEALPLEIQNLGWAFLRDVQYLHDSGENWTATGLSELGNKRIKNLEIFFLIFNA